MINAPSLPAAPTPMPPGFGAFLAAIGPLPDGGEAGFDQLFAAAPTAPPAPAASVTPPVAAAPVVAAASIPIERALTVGGAATQAAAPVEAEAARPNPTVKNEASDAEAAAATLAATLLVVLGGSRPGGAPAHGPADPVKADVEADVAPGTEAVAAPAASGQAAAPAAATNWIALPVAAAAATKPAKAVDAAPKPTGDPAPIMPAAARPRDATTPPSALAVRGAETRAANPAEAVPSITILFTQPAVQGAVTVAAAAAPVQVAERILDMTSDGVWIDQLARDIAATKSDSGDISFRLMPRHLGRLDVAMRVGDEGVSLKLDTQHEATATIVTAAQGRLVDELRQQGVRVAGAEVSCTSGETGRQSQGQGRAAAPDPTHLIETATEGAGRRPETDNKVRAADRRGRFA